MERVTYLISTLLDKSKTVVFWKSVIVASFIIFWIRDKIVYVRILEELEDDENLINYYWCCFIICFRWVLTSRKKDNPCKKDNVSCIHSRLFFSKKIQDKDKNQSLSGLAIDVIFIIPTLATFGKETITFWAQKLLPFPIESALIEMNKSPQRSLI